MFTQAAILFSTSPLKNNNTRNIDCLNIYTYSYMYYYIKYDWYIKLTDHIVLFAHIM